MKPGRVARRATVVVAAAGMAAAAIAAAAASASRSPAYCSLPAAPANPAWAFHVGAPIFGARGAYAHGRGTLGGSTASGQICQVDRVPASTDRQIILTVTRGHIVHRGGVVVGGVLGTLLVLPVRVLSTTDPRCAAGTRGTVTLVNSYNGVHKDSVKLAFPRSCRDHDHYYRGRQVVVVVPR